MAQAKSECKRGERRKLALVIGNDKYQHFLALKNAGQDANAMASKLKNMGFNVARLIDATHDKMKRPLCDFEVSIERNDMVLFYYAGHGAQWEVSSETHYHLQYVNYLHHGSVLLIFLF